VRIIAKRMLREFWVGRSHDSDQANRYFKAWRTRARRVDWADFGELRETFGSADQVGSCVVFDVGNNCYRLICRVNFETGMVFTLKAMGHTEYDLGRWVVECNCRGPRPPCKPRR
jgi:mRNA interferase HigB